MNGSDADRDCVKRRYISPYPRVFRRTFGLPRATPSVRWWVDVPIGEILAYNRQQTAQRRTTKQERICCDIDSGHVIWEAGSGVEGNEGRRKRLDRGAGMLAAPMDDRWSSAAGRDAAGLDKSGVKL